jgi:hypothetical protein
MGFVYEAIGPLGVHIALKVIHPQKFNPMLMVRFQQEARAMMELDHPNLIRFYDYGEHEGKPYLTMKLLSGRTLANLLPDCWRDPKVAVQLAIRIAGAVGFVHSRRKVHRDLKPTNVLLDDRDEPVVSDFGLIKEADASDVIPLDGAGPTAGRGYSSTLTRTGARLGTPSYMSPEQAAGNQSRIGPPTDVWALGVMLHEMVWGQQPCFTEDFAVDFPKWPGQPDREEPSILTPIRNVISRCLQFDPDARFASANDLRDDLESLLQPPAVTTQPKWRKYFWAATTVVLAAVAIGIGWRAILPPPKDQPPTVATKDALTVLKEELAEKSEVDLLDAHGQWRWHEWMTSEADWHTEPRDGVPGDARGWFSAPAGNILLLELARGLPRFRLEMELANVGPRGTVGIYAGRSVHHVNNTPWHCLLAVELHDHGLNPGANGKPRLARYLYARRCPTKTPGGFFTAPELDRSIAEGTLAGWTKVSIELDESELNATHSGQAFKPQTRNRLMQLAGRQLGFAVKGAEGLTPTFHPSEGVGLFVDGGTLAVKSARLSISKD